MKIYYYICEKFEQSLQFECERFSNNKRPKLTYQEIITIYLFAMHHLGIFKIKQIDRFALDYLRGWFPNLGSYQALNNRLNRISGVMNTLVDELLTDFQPKCCCSNQSLLDSMPIITCSGKRQGKVAKEITSKGYCSTKSMFYYGMKLHAMGYLHIDRLPHLEQIIFTPASVNDLSLYKDAWTEINDRTFFGDKIYINEDFFKNMNQKYNS